MAKKYLDQLSSFIDKLEINTRTSLKLECKHFFSGAALYADERICLTLTPVGLALKLSEEVKNSLIKKNKAVPLKYFPKSPVKKDYALFPEGISNSKFLHSHIKECIEYVITLPTPKRKTK